DSIFNLTIQKSEDSCLSIHLLILKPLPTRD
ncbi:MAG: hypothetical protein ACI9LA_001463, partial [Bacteroidia bacterium]